MKRCLLVAWYTHETMSHVLDMLAIKDVVHLDSAACSHQSRQVLDSEAAAFNLNDQTKPQRYSSCPIVWNWFWKRNWTIKGLGVHQLGLEDIDKNDRWVESPVTLYYGEKSRFSQNRGFAGNVADYSAALRVISGIYFLDERNTAELIAVLPRMTKLTSIEDDRALLSDKEILQILHLSPNLSELKIQNYLIVELLEAILRLGPTLRKLSFRPVLRNQDYPEQFYTTEDHYKRLAVHLPHLTNLRLYTSNDQNCEMRAGLAVLARCCRHLQEVQVSDSCSTDEFLLLFATHCPELRKFTCAKITDAALDTMADHCPHLVDISACWAVESLAVVHSAAAWLARLKHVRLLGLKEDASGTLFKSLECLRAAEVLTLHGQVDFSEANLSRVAAHCTHLRELNILLLTNKMVSTASVEAIVRVNRGLQVVRFADKVWLTDAVLEAIAESCPLLRVLEVTCGWAPPSLTDGAVVKLAKGCPQLRHLTGCSGPGLTEASVLALAEHCRHLEKVDFTDSSQVTAEALVQLVKRTAEGAEPVVVFQPWVSSSTNNKRAQQEESRHQGAQEEDNLEVMVHALLVALGFAIGAVAVYLARA